MPVIFNEQNRDEIRAQMLENGFALLKQNGVRRMTVSNIAKASGFAKGTFYTFFDSKEEFIYQLLLSRREMARKYFDNLATKNGGIGRNEFSAFLDYLQDPSINIYHYLSEQDKNYLETRWPQAYLFNPQADEKTTLWLLSQLKGLRPKQNWKILTNYMKIVANMNMMQELMHKDAIVETELVMRQGLLDYLFEA